MKGPPPLCSEARKLVFGPTTPGLHILRHCLNLVLFCQYKTKIRDPIGLEFSRFMRPTSWGKAGEGLGVWTGGEHEKGRAGPLVFAVTMRDPRPLRPDRRAVWYSNERDLCGPSLGP